MRHDGSPGRPHSDPRPSDQPSVPARRRAGDRRCVRRDDRAGGACPPARGASSGSPSRRVPCAEGRSRRPPIPHGRAWVSGLGRAHRLDGARERAPLRADRPPRSLLPLRPARPVPCRRSGSRPRRGCRARVRAALCFPRGLRRPGCPLAPGHDGVRDRRQDGRGRARHPPGRGRHGRVPSVGPGGPRHDPRCGEGGQGQGGARPDARGVPDHGASAPAVEERLGPGGLPARDRGAVGREGHAAHGGAGPGRVR